MFAAIRSGISRGHLPLACSKYLYPNRGLYSEFIQVYKHSTRQKGEFAYRTDTIKHFRWSLRKYQIHLKDFCEQLSLSNKRLKRKFYSHYNTLLLTQYLSFGKNISLTVRQTLKL